MDVRVWHVPNSGLEDEMKIKTIVFAVLIMLLMLMPSCAPAPTPAPAEPAAETAAPAEPAAPAAPAEPVDEKAQIAEAAKEEGELISYGMSDDWVNLGNIWKAIEDKYGVIHTDTDMTSAEQITRLLAEKNAPVMDMADIGYDFLGPLLENDLATTYRNASWDKIPDNFKDPDGRWASSYWGAISFLVNTDLVENLPQTWDDLLKPEYKDQVCSRDPRVSTYATASVLSAAYAHGGGEDNVQPGLDFFKQLRESGNLREGVVLNVAAVQKGECPISMVYDFDGFAKRDATGLPLEVVIPSDATVGMLFAQYISSAAPHPNAAKLGIDFMFSDEGQVMLAQGYAHPTRDVTLPEDVAAKMLPESAYGNLHFPTSLESFSGAVKNIVDGWNAIVGATETTPAAPAADPLAALIEPAKQEAMIVSYGLPDDWVNYGGQWAVLKEKYGIEHQDTDMSSGEILAALKVEATAPVADITDLGFNFAQVVNDEDLALPYKNQHWDDIPEWAKDPDGRWAAAYWGAVAFTVNKDKFAEVPQTWDDLLKPEYKDSICMKDPRQSATANMVVLAAAYAKGGDETNPQPGLDFFKQLIDAGQMRPIAPSTSAIQKGECPISLFWDFDGLSKLKDLGMNLAVVIPTDGTVAGLYIQFITKGAPHPNAAKLLVEQEFSDEGQLIYANGFVHPIRSSVTLPDELLAMFPPAEAYEVVQFPKDFAALTAAATAISDGWTLIAGQ
jgi:putative spermidine/putrescine transport system substrate-binding protein